MAKDSLIIHRLEYAWYGIEATRNANANGELNVFIIAFVSFIVICRAVCGVHWLTDIIGGIILSAAMIMLYAAFTSKSFTKE